MKLELENYDNNNIFAKIIRGDIPAKKIAENEDFLAFEDINPTATIHVLVIPKIAYTCFPDFMARADSKQISSFFQFVASTAEKLNLHTEDAGYRIVSNYAEQAGQTVPHFHIHIIGGNKLGSMA